MGTALTPDAALAICELWFEKHSPTAELINGLGRTEHPMLTMIKASLKAHAEAVNAAPFMLQALQTIALHAPSLDAQGIRELADEAIAKAEGK